MALPIALAEDNAVNRSTFMHKVHHYPDLQVLFTALDGNECLDCLKLLPVDQQPLVVFVDLEMPEMNGIQTIQIAKTLYPHIHFIVLTVFDDEEKIFEAIKAGAGGYLLKDENAASIRSAVSSVLDFGGAPMSPAIARKAMNMLGRASVRDADDGNSEVDNFLSEREKEILQHTIQGLDARQIAETLNISVLTVRKHIANIYERLHVHSKAQVIHLANKRKWFI